ncbi:hypothetical protein ACFL6H_01020 [Candidatus Latescibacterota bacterium]
MKRFARILSHINERLVLPQPLKYRIMKEIAADLEDTFNTYTQKGFDENEAEQKALKKIAADDSVIEQLIEVHETPVRKILRRLSDKMLHRIEITLWISLIVIIGVIVSAFLFSSNNFSESPFNWLTGLFILSIFGISVSKYYELFIKREHTLITIHRGLSLLIFICCLTMLIGTLGFFVELQESVSISRYGESEFDTAIILLFRSFSVICFSYASAITGAIIWLILTLKTLNIEDKENEFLVYETDK